MAADFYTARCMTALAHSKYVLPPSSRRDIIKLIEREEDRVGLLGRLFRRKTQPVTMLEEAIESLQVSILINLVSDYHERLELQPRSDAATLAYCVLSYATVTSPLRESALLYEKTHGDLIRKEAEQLVESREVSKALSYLYAAITLLLAIRTNDPLSELSAQLGARATELSLYVPNTYDICGSGDAVECIQAIAVFAVNYKRTQTR